MVISVQNSTTGMIVYPDGLESNAACVFPFDPSTATFSQIYYYNSSDCGASWMPNVSQFVCLSVHLCICLCVCQSSVIFLKRSTVYIVFNNALTLNTFSDTDLTDLIAFFVMPSSQGKTHSGNVVVIKFTIRKVISCLKYKHHRRTI